MLGLTLKDVVVDIVIVGVVLAFAVGIAANFASDALRRRAGKIGDSGTQVGREPIAPPAGWAFRRWGYFLGCLAVVLFTLFLWIAFWYPLVQASSVAGLSASYQALIPPVSAMIFLALALYLFDFLLPYIVRFEEQYGGQVRDIRGLLARFVLPFIAVTAAIVLLISSVVGFLMVLSGMALTPGRLMSWIYGVILASTIVWLVLTFLTSSPFVLQAFRSNEPEKKGE